MDAWAPVCEDIYRDYLAHLGEAWDSLAPEDSGMVRDGDAILAPL